MKKIDIRKIEIIGIIAVFLLITGCATHISKPAKEIMPAKVRFGEFKNVEMKSVGISEKFASAAANQKALKKIDEILFRDMKFSRP